MQVDGATYTPAFRPRTATTVPSKSHAQPGDGFERSAPGPQLIPRHGLWREGLKGGALGAAVGVGIGALLLASEPVAAPALAMALMVGGGSISGAVGAMLHFVRPNLPNLPTHT